MKNQKGVVDFDQLTRFVGSAAALLAAVGMAVIWTSLDMQPSWVACTTRMLGAIMVGAGAWIGHWLRGVL